MSSSKTCESKIFSVIHEMASDFHKDGLMDKKTMRKFDELCLTPIQALTPEEIREIRNREHVSQAVFARYLNVTAGLISKWERGEKTPTGPSLKLLLLAQKKGLEAIA